MSIQPNPKQDHEPNMLYGVHCHRCGDQGLIANEYERQMNMPDSVWRCPVCNQEAFWDDDRYDRTMEAQNE